MRDDLPLQVPAAFTRDLTELAAAIARIEAEIAASGMPAADGLPAAERIKDIALALRDLARRVDAMIALAAASRPRLEPLAVTRQLRRLPRSPRLRSRMTRRRRRVRSRNAAAAELSEPGAADEIRPAVGALRHCRAPTAPAAPPAVALRPRASLRAVFAHGEATGGAALPVAAAWLRRHLRLGRLLRPAGGSSRRGRRDDGSPRGVTSSGGSVATTLRAPSRAGHRSAPTDKETNAGDRYRHQTSL